MAKRRFNAQRFYDRFGAMQDTQGFYERPALHDLRAHVELGSARSVVEFGCGTGRFAAELLNTDLPPETTYLALDISRTMVELTAGRLNPFGTRAQVRQSDGSPRIDAADGAFDRFISNYVLDLLPDDEIRAVLDEAHRVLAPGGLLGVASLTNGPGPISRLVSTVWCAAHTLSPWLVGGCRPIELLRYISAPRWNLTHRAVVTPYGVPSEIVVAIRT